MGLCDACKDNLHEKHTSHYAVRVANEKSVPKTCTCACTLSSRPMVGDNRAPFWKPAISRGEDRVRELRQRQGRRPLTPMQRKRREERLRTEKKWRAL